MGKEWSGLRIRTSRGAVFARICGDGPPVLLLHGFPETSLMWRDVVPLLSNTFTVVAADLPGYGESDCPADRSMSKRSMAETLLEAMVAIGFNRFAVAGHDRGGRVGYRMALDHPNAVIRLAVLDVLPIAEVWRRADDRLVLTFWPFSLLAQPAPLPEQLILGAPHAVIDNALSQWGADARVFSPEVREDYIRAISDPAHVHSICDEYRAAASIDREHDEADEAADRMINCPVCVLWSSGGPLDAWYAEHDGPIGIWRRIAPVVSGEAMPGGHFFPEVFPLETGTKLARFLSGA